MDAEAMKSLGSRPCHRTRSNRACFGIGLLLQKQWSQSGAFRKQLKVQTAMILAIAFTEAIAILCVWLCAILLSLFKSFRFMVSGSQHLSVNHKLTTDN